MFSIQHRTSQWWLTLVGVISVTAQSQRAAADVTAETLSVKEVALRAQSLHHVHSLLTEVAGVAAAQTLREILSQGGLKHRT